MLRLHKLSFVNVLIEDQGEFELLGDFIDRALSVVLQVGRRENRVKYHPIYVNKSKVRLIPEGIVENFGNDAGKKRAGYLETGVCVDLDQVQLEVFVKHEIVPEKL